MQRTATLKRTRRPPGTTIGSGGGRDLRGRGQAKRAETTRIPPASTLPPEAPPTSAPSPTMTSESEAAAAAALLAAAHAARTDAPVYLPYQHEQTRSTDEFPLGLGGRGGEGIGWLSNGGNGNGFGSSTPLLGRSIDIQAGLTDPSSYRIVSNRPLHQDHQGHLLQRGGMGRAGLQGSASDSELILDERTALSLEPEPFMRVIQGHIQYMRQSLHLEEAYQHRIHPWSQPLVTGYNPGTSEYEPIWEGGAVVEAGCGEYTFGSSPSASKPSLLLCSGWPGSITSTSSSDSAPTPGSAFSTASALVDISATVYSAYSESQSEDAHRSPSPELKRGFETTREGEATNPNANLCVIDPAAYTEIGSETEGQEEEATKRLKVPWMLENAMWTTRQAISSCHYAHWFFQIVHDVYSRGEITPWQEWVLLLQNQPKLERGLSPAPEMFPMMPSVPPYCFGEFGRSLHKSSNSGTAYSSAVACEVAAMPGTSKVSPHEISDAEILHASMTLLSDEALDQEFYSAPMQRRQSDFNSSNIDNNSVGGSSSTPGQAPGAVSFAMLTELMLTDLGPGTPLGQGSGSELGQQTLLVSTRDFFSMLLDCDSNTNLGTSTQLYQQQQQQRQEQQHQEQLQHCYQQAQTLQHDPQQHDPQQRQQSPSIRQTVTASVPPLTRSCPAATFSMKDGENSNNGDVDMEVDRHNDKSKSNCEYFLLDSCHIGIPLPSPWDFQNHSIQPSFFARPISQELEVSSSLGLSDTMMTEAWSTSVDSLLAAREQAEHDGFASGSRQQCGLGEDHSKGDRYAGVFGDGCEAGQRSREGGLLVGMKANFGNSGECFGGGGFGGCPGTTVFSRQLEAHSHASTLVSAPNPIPIPTSTTMAVTTMMRLLSPKLAQRVKESADAVLTRTIKACEFSEKNHREANEALERFKALNFLQDSRGHEQLRQERHGPPRSTVALGVTPATTAAALAGVWATDGATPAAAAQQQKQFQTHRQQEQRQQHEQSVHSELWKQQTTELCQPFEVQHQQGRRQYQLQR